MDINVVLCTLLLFGAAFAKDIGSVVTDNSDEWSLDLCRRSYEEQAKAIHKLQDAMSMQFAKQDERISQNQNQTEKLSNEVEYLKQHVNARPDIRYDLNGTGCFMDVITMNCVGNGTLSITNAIYGKYANSCTGCCAPGSDDCTVPMSDQSPSEWDTLLEECNGQTSCSHQYEGEVINNCEAGYVADYMQISYTCPPDNVVLNDAIGFTAIHDDDVTYSNGSILQFNNVVTNIGNHYNPSNYTFTCPIKGMYLFSVSLLSNSASSDSRLAIMRDKIKLIDLYLDDYNSNGLPTASAVVIAECDIGQHVYVQATVSYAYIDGTHDSSHFSGALIQRF